MTRYLKTTLVIGSGNQKNQANSNINQTTVIKIQQNNKVYHAMSFSETDISINDAISNYLNCLKSNVKFVYF